MTLKWINDHLYNELKLIRRLMPIELASTIPRELRDVVSIMAEYACYDPHLVHYTFEMNRHRVEYTDDRFGLEWEMTVYSDDYECSRDNDQDNECVHECMCTMVVQIHCGAGEWKYRNRDPDIWKLLFEDNHDEIYPLDVAICHAGIRGSLEFNSALGNLGDTGDAHIIAHRLVAKMHAAIIDAACADIERCETCNADTYCAKK